jgi:hypothetical protein
VKDSGSGGGGGAAGEKPSPEEILCMREGFSGGAGGDAIQIQYEVSKSDNHR